MGMLRPLLDESLYALLAGRSGGQTLIGGTASGNNLTLQSTSHATKGKVLIGGSTTLVADEANTRVGIGTASPSTLLHAAADAAAFHRFSVAGSGAAVYPSLQLDRYRGTNASPAAVSAADVLGEIQFRGYTDAAKSSAHIKCLAATGYGASGNDAPGILTFETSADGSATPTERMRITPEGYVGVGCTSPDQLLCLEGAAGGAGTSPVTLKLNSTTSAVTFTADTIQTQILFECSDATGGAGVRGAIKSVVQDTAGADFGLSFWTTTNGSGAILEAMRIDHRGNVGIGTTAPSATTIFECASTTKASIPAPKMTTTQRDAISSPTAGMVIYNTSTNVLNFYNGTTWGAV
jgi:hypothetical protein